METGTFSAVATGNAGGETGSGGRTRSADPPPSAYDATRAQRARCEGRPDATYWRTVGAWPPVWRVVTHSPLDYQGLAAVVRAAVEDGDHSVGIKPLKEGDRAVWRAAMTMGGQAVELVVDQQTGIVTWYSDGKDHIHGGGLGRPAARRPRLWVTGRTGGRDVDLGGGSSYADFARGRGQHRRLRPARLASWRPRVRR